jgi:hypothetical protein
MTRGPKGPDKKDTATKYIKGDQFPHPNSINHLQFSLYDTSLTN